MRMKRVDGQFGFVFWESIMRGGITEGIAIENRSYGNGGLASMMGAGYKRERSQEVI